MLIKLEQKTKVNTKHIQTKVKKKVYIILSIAGLRKHRSTFCDKCNQFSFAALVLCYILGYYFDWRGLAIAGALLPLPYLCVMYFIPETPRWYMWARKHHCNTFLNLSVVTLKTSRQYIWNLTAIKFDTSLRSHLKPPCGCIWNFTVVTFKTSLRLHLKLHCGYI